MRLGEKFLLPTGIRNLGRCGISDASGIFAARASIYREKALRSPILAPVIALVLWSFVMMAWLYAMRIPALLKHGIVYDTRRPAEEFHAQLPAQVRWKADNFNNLMEQPTLFYAVALTLAIVDAGAGFNAALAWLYVGLRILHSLVQAIFNIVLARFALFMTASVVLLLMTLRAALIVFQ
jgi:hypothetical protein